VNNTNGIIHPQSYFILMDMRILYVYDEGRPQGARKLSESCTIFWCIQQPWTSGPIDDFLKTKIYILSLLVLFLVHFQGESIINDLQVW